MKENNTVSPISFASWGSFNRDDPEIIRDLKFQVGGYEKGERSGEREELWVERCIHT